VDDALARALEAAALAEALDLQDDCFWEEDIGDIGDIGFEARDWPATQRSNGVAFSFQQEHVGWDRCKLKLLVVQRSDAWTAELWHDARLFEAAAVERMAEHWAVLMGSFGERPGRGVGDIDLRSEEERRHLASFNCSSRHPAQSSAFPLAIAPYPASIVSSFLPKHNRPRCLGRSCSAKADSATRGTPARSTAAAEKASSSTSIPDAARSTHRK
jgi:hypothetical protein